MRANLDNLVKDLTTSEKEILLNYLRAKFPLFSNSNLFFRDLQYGIRAYYESKGLKLSYGDSEEVAKRVSELYEKENLLTKINDSAWKVNYEPFITTKIGDPL